MSKELEPKSSIDVIQWNDEEFEGQFLGDIKNDYEDVRKILDNLPATLKIYFDNEVMSSDYAVDGHAHAHDIVTLIMNRKSEFTHDEYKMRLRETLFHELFHVRQNFTYEDDPQPALYAAIYEGCATVFAREYTDARPPHGDYSVESEAQLNAWKEEMSTIPASEYFDADSGAWQKWAFIDPETGERWRVYKVGTWIVDKVIEHRGIDIVDLRDVTPKQVIEWFEVANA